MRIIFSLLVLLFCFSAHASVKQVTEEDSSSPYLKIVAADRKMLDFSNHSIGEIKQEEEASLYTEEVNNILRKYCYKITFTPKLGEDVLPFREIVGSEAVGLSPWNAFQKASKGDGVRTPERARRYKENYTVEISDTRVEFLSFRHCGLDDETFSKLSYYISGFTSLQSVDLRHNHLTKKSIEELLRIARRTSVKVIILSHNDSNTFEFIDELATKGLENAGPGCIVEDLLNKFIVTTKDQLSVVGGKTSHWSTSWEDIHKRFYKLA